MFVGEPAKWTTDPRRIAEHSDILMSVRAPVGPVNFTSQRICIGRGLAAIRPRVGYLHSKFAFYVLRGMESEITGSAGAAFASINKGDIQKIPMPLPPLEVQEEIVAEIEGYQKVIDGARAVVENYRPHIHVDPEWPMVELGEYCEIIMGQSPSGKTYNKVGNGVPLINGPVEFGPEAFSETLINQFTTAPTKMCQKGDLILCVRGSTTGRMNIAGYSGCIGRGVAAIRSSTSQQWVNYVIHTLRDQIYRLGSGSTFPNVSRNSLAEIPIPVPPPNVQEELVNEFEAERSVVAANRDLIERMDKKIQRVVGRVW